MTVSLGEEQRPASAVASPPSETRPFGRWGAPALFLAALFLATLGSRDVLLLPLVALTPDGDRVLTRDRDYTVRVWRTAELEGTVAFEPMNEDGMGFTGVARLSNGSERLVGRDNYGVVDMWCLPPP